MSRGWCIRRDTLEMHEYQIREDGRVEVYHADKSVAVLERWRWDKFFAIVYNRPVIS